MVNSEAPKSGISPITLTLILTGFIATTYGFGVYLFPAVMPDMVAALSLSYAQAGGIIGLAQIGFMLSALASGFLTHKIGAIRLVLLSGLTTALCLFLVPFVSGSGVLTLLMFILGASSASVWVPMVAIAKQLIPVSHQGKALGLMSSGTAYGVFVNGLTIPVLMPLYGWKSIWFFVAFLTGLLLLFAWFRFSGICLNSNPLASHEHQARTSVEFKKFFQLKILIIPLMMFLGGLACMPTQNFLVSFVRDELDYGVAAAANIWTTIGFIGMFGGFAMGILADRITVGRALSFSFALLALSILAFLRHGSIIEVYFGAACFGLAFNAIFGLIPAYVSLTYPVKMTVTVFGMGNIMLGLGATGSNVWQLSWRGPERSDRLFPTNLHFRFGHRIDFDRIVISSLEADNTESIQPELWVIDIFHCGLILRVFCYPAASWPADSLALNPSFSPWPWRWTFTIVPSIIAYSLSGSSLKALNIR